MSTLKKQSSKARRALRYHRNTDKKKKTLNAYMIATQPPRKAILSHSTFGDVFGGAEQGGRKKKKQKRKEKKKNESDMIQLRASSSQSLPQQTDKRQPTLTLKRLKTQHATGCVPTGPPVPVPATGCVPTGPPVPVPAAWLRVNGAGAWLRVNGAGAWLRVNGAGAWRERGVNKHTELKNK